LKKAISERNFFTGLNPFLLFNLISNNEQLSTSIASIQMNEPWLWNLGPRSYAVVPFIISKHAK
jgi:hypothetical protein